ncbi:hypothetical protein [uncultured Algoriphagus sp.]|uniref:hypothetical protein n=1 Tax=uncultured Algoriphagus sp. TaxID=417365 RepID=UPI00259249C6|nr:hypothetical protein [uncultured Algoriphagus sp.]
MSLDMGAGVWVKVPSCYAWHQYGQHHRSPLSYGNQDADRGGPDRYQHEIQSGSGL